MTSGNVDIVNRRGPDSDSGAESPPVALVHAKTALILLAFACFATEHLVHYPVALMAVFGIYQALRHPRALRTSAARSLIIIFALIWLPMLIAWSDAVAPDRSGKTVLLYLHFLPATYFVLRACRDAEVLRLVTLGVAALVLFVAFDAFVQLIWQVNLFGYPYEKGILTGVFHPKQRLGLFLAVFAPLVVDAIRMWSRQYPQLWLFLIPLVLAILMSLKRGAWLMLMLGLVIYPWLRWRCDGRALSYRRVVQLVAVLVIAVGASALSPVLKHRLAQTGGLFSTDMAAFEDASGHRLSLWRTGYRAFQTHWLNGIGPRGYRDAYADFAPADDFWLARSGSGQTHPHLLGLEIAVETGVIGALAFAVFYVFLIKLMLQPTIGNRVPVWLIGAGIAWFPFNAHLAFYGSYWSTFVWLMLGVGLASIRQNGSAPNGHL